MRYVSPFALSGIDGTSTVADKSLLQQTRKRLLAEFELAGNAATIDLNGKAFTKSEMLDLLDSLQDAEKLRYHQAIHTDVGLLKFLLHDQLPQNGRLASDPIYGEKKFIAFLSPYFQYSYEQVIDLAFRKRDVRQIRNLNTMPLLVENSYEENCFRPVRREIQKIISSITEVVQGRWPRRFEPREADLMGNVMLVQCIDELPARLQALRDDYASHLLDQALYIWNNCSGDQMALRLLGQVDNMKTGLEIKNRSQRLRTKMKTPPVPPPPSFTYTPPSTSTQSGPSAGRIILIVLKVIVLLFIIGRACNNSSLRSSRNSYDYLKNMPDFSRTLKTLEVNSLVKNPAYKLATYIKAEQFNYGSGSSDSRLVTGKNKKNKKKYRSLETGTPVYENCFSRKPRGYSQSLTIHNTSNNDAVILIGADESKGNAYYVKAGTSFKIDSIYLFKSYIFAYAGNDWDDTLSLGTHYFSDVIPAAEIIGCFKQPCTNSSSLLASPVNINMVSEMSNYGSRGTLSDYKSIVIKLTETEGGYVYLKRIGAFNGSKTKEQETDSEAEPPVPVSEQ